MTVLREDGGEFALHLAGVLHEKLAQADKAMSEAGGGDDTSHRLWLKHARYVANEKTQLFRRKISKYAVIIRSAAKLCMECLVAENVSEDLVASKRESLALSCCESLLLLLNTVTWHFSSKLPDFLAGLTEDGSDDVAGGGLGRLCDVIFHLASSACVRADEEQEESVAAAATSRKVVGALVRVLLFVFDNLNAQKEEDAVVVKRVRNFDARPRILYRVFVGLGGIIEARFCPHSDF